MLQLLEAVFLGLIEGLTEFLPVSSTGHLLLVGHFLGFESTGKTFEVLIQLGAILAILAVYFGRLRAIARALPDSPQARRFVMGVLIAFLPAAAVGAVLHGFIKEVLFNPWIVCATLIAGGLVLLIVAVLLVVVGVVAFRQLMSFHPAALITPGGGAPAAPSGAQSSPSASTAPSPSATAGTSPARKPVEIAGVQALDPQGDDSENNDLAARAIDNDTGSAWRSERYDSAQFGGIKRGVGLAVDLGDPVDVSAVSLTAPGSGGIVELRSADNPDYNGSNRVAQGRVGGSGKVVLTPGKAVRTRYLVVWFTRAPLQGNGEHRVIVAEIDVR